MAGRLYQPAAVVSLAGQTIGDALGPFAGLTGEQPRVSFRVRRTLTPTPDSAEVEIHGLSPERRSAMAALWSELGYAQLEIRAGYDGRTSRLFRGGVRELRVPPRDGSPVVATADDGGDQIAGAPIRISGAALTPRNLVDLALAALSTPFPGGPAVVEPITEHPSVAVALASANPGAGIVVVQAGKAADLLDEVARFVGARWWVQDGLLHMTRLGQPTDRSAVLIDRPRLLAEPTEDAEGLRIKTLLDPRIVPGRQLRLDGRIAPWSSEALRVESADYRGDTEGNSPWSVDLAASRLA